MTLPAVIVGDEASPKGRWQNHRATVRYQCGLAEAGRVLLPGDEEFQRGWLQDMSTKGIGLLLKRSLPDGIEILIRLKAHETAKTFDVTARAVHSRQLSNGDFLVGCEFVNPITNEDLDQLL